MLLTCKNCSRNFKGNFCGYCGQKANTQRMDLHFLWHDIQHGILHVDKGFFYTISQLFKRPGHAIREFLEGKRVKHFKPIPLLFILAGVYALLNHYFSVDFVNNLKISEGSSEIIIKTVESVKEWIAQHYGLATILGLPVYSAGTYFAFRKMHYTFIEHIVITAFYESQKLIARIVLFPLIYFYNGSDGLKFFLMAVNFSLMIWVMFQLFNKEKKSYVFFRILLSQLISLAIIFVLLAIFIAGLVVYIQSKKII